MTDNAKQTAFPDQAEDGDVFFHKDMAFYYHAAINTWEGWRVNKWAEEEDE